MADLVRAHDRLLALRAALPDSQAEAEPEPGAPAELPEPEPVAGEPAPRDARVELVGAIECVLHDELEPAIRALRQAAALAPAALR